MFCLRCGKETREGQVFCDDCLNVMEEYPIKPGTVIQLPTRQDKPPARRPARKQRSLPPEEQVPQLRRLIRRLAVAVSVLALLLCVTAAALARTYFHGNTDRNIGKNYTTTGPAPLVPIR